MNKTLIFIVIYVLGFSFGHCQINSLVKTYSDNVWLGKPYTFEIITPDHNVELTFEGKVYKSDSNRYTFKIPTVDKKVGRYSWSVVAKSKTGHFKVLEGVYNVIKPTLFMASGSVLALYKDCSNSILISCPALGADSSPIFSINFPDSNQILENGAKGELNVIPQTNKVVITVNQNGLKSAYPFRVREVPIPDVNLMLTRIYQVEKGDTLSKSKLTNLNLKLIQADKYFDAFCSQDNRFILDSYQLKVVRKGKVKKSFTVTRTTNFFNKQTLKKVQEGDVIILSNFNIKRRNYREEVVQVGINEREISFVVK